MNGALLVNSQESIGMHNLLELVYANHVRELVNTRQCELKDAFNFVDDIRVIREFIRETVELRVERGARNAFISKLCNAEWRINEMKTETWKERVSEMVISMNRVENRM